jgi:hypothetical protein
MQFYSPDVCDLRVTLTILFCRSVLFVFEDKEGSICLNNALRPALHDNSL